MPNTGQWIESAILVVDMCNFSHIMEKHGVLHTLEIVKSLQSIATVATNNNNGRIIKFWADNVLAIFPSTDEALEAASTIMSQQPVSIGIGYGESYEVDNDLYGVELNKACKLGEDIAECGEILLTDNAKKKLNE